MLAGPNLMHASRVRVSAPPSWRGAVPFLPLGFTRCPCYCHGGRHNASSLPNAVDSPPQQEQGHDQQQADHLACPLSHYELLSLPSAASREVCASQLWGKLKRTLKCKTQYVDFAR